MNVNLIKSMFAVSRVLIMCFNNNLFFIINGEFFNVYNFKR